MKKHSHLLLAMAALALFAKSISADDATSQLRAEFLEKYNVSPEAAAGTSDLDEPSATEQSNIKIGSRIPPEPDPRFTPPTRSGSLGRSAIELPKEVGRFGENEAPTDAKEIKLDDSWLYERNVKKLKELLANARNRVRQESSAVWERVGGPDAINVQPGQLEDCVVMLNECSRQGVCSGVIVAPQLVLTAAHCVYCKETGARTRIRRIGIGTSINSLTDPDIVDVAAEFPHANFRRINGYDVALLILERPVDPSRVRVIASESLIAEIHSVRLAGFGKSDFGALSGNAGLGTKRRVDVAMMNFQYGGREFLAGSKGNDSCGGDSGGPAYALPPDPTTPFSNATIPVAGLTSRGVGNGCGRDGGVYTTLRSELITWIGNQVAAYESRRRFGVFSLTGERTDQPLIELPRIVDQSIYADSTENASESNAGSGAED
ncbi:S1 family peptidase [Stratiformator vulcanicus]|uniref:Trypsin n=1 Tax=Stratiformator vulcanicus TaxID=2527980 RepID=A0A517QXM8_9PLAN|nr:trypsin-like serine protease [Stratiformator vulcanicus]QDT36364.1 Trypsin [Stratiformator vulcanicus]